MIKNNLLNLRLERKYKKQKDFAAFLGISESYYNKLENNKSVMTVDTLFQIAKKLNIDINEIVFEEEQ
ncbi:helix-turn-helix transcriptional regulator [uncultured Clostridium sp.]|uniref:helix-turn-helix transcriptional regulator n=1 Tax=uncultured Clostridium sp. TaxID=59620 RepID=UPI00260BAC4E|nr:helix-turn-helix transcriptional regulator [uncultured Clostridium sp.]